MRLRLIFALCLQILSLIIIYAIGYLTARRSHEFIHRTSYSGEEVYHSIASGVDGPLVFVGLAMTDGGGEDLKARLAAYGRYEQFRYRFYAPAANIEVWIWEAINPPFHRKNIESGG
jgi:hypothetical protein